MNIPRILTILLTCAGIVFLVLMLSDPYFFANTKKMQKTGEAKLEEGILGNKLAFKQASHYFNSLLEQGHTDRKTYDLLYWSYRYDKNHAQGEETLTEALELYPDDPEFLYQRAESRLELQKYEQAIEDYTRVIETGPDFEYLSDVLYSRGAARYKLGNKAEAEQDRQLAMKKTKAKLEPYEVYFDTAK
ncbi:hypothetical protein OB13_00380 [Pontibacter sp. HJ8]